MTTSEPTLSIVTPNYNHAHYLEHCVASIRNQSLAVFEHVIVDDGSTDNSRALLPAIAAANPDVRVVLSPQNEGVALAIRRGIEIARGDFVLVLSADDALPNNSVELFMTTVRKNPDAVFACGEIEYSNGQKTWRRRYIDADQPVFLSPRALAKYQRSMLTVVNGAAVVRRDVALTCAICDPALKWVGDMIGYTVIAYRHGLWYIPEVVHRYAINETNMSKKAQIWRFEKPVLDRVFELLQSSAFQDVKRYYRTSAALAELPLLMRYMAVHPGTWNFLTFRLILNSTIFYLYRTWRKFVPQPVIDAYIRMRSTARITS